MLRDRIQSVTCGLIAVGSRARCRQVVANIVAVITLVAEEAVRIDVMQFHQRIVGFALLRSPAGHVESQRIALGVRAEMDFGREAATRAAERFLILIPPFTPAACWCALTMVASMACSLSAGGPRLAKVSNAASHTPSLLQRVKRTKTEFQLPYRSGMSRHGAPVRRTQRIPLTVRRLSGIGGPGEQRVENAPFRVRYIAPTQCCLLQKGSLESKLDSSVKNRQHALVS